MHSLKYIKFMFQ